MKSEARSADTKPTIVWFRQDLRVHDNPALTAAVAHGSPVVPIYIWSPEEEGDWRLGGASRWWLRRSLEHLADTLRALGSDLVFLKGSTVRAIDEIRLNTGADTIVWNRRYEPAAIEIETYLKDHLAATGGHADTYEATRLTPVRVDNKAGLPFKRFTPFYKTFLSQAPVDRPLNAPEHISSGGWRNLGNKRQLVLDAIHRTPERNSWNRAGRWTPGTQGAQELLDRFLTEQASKYVDGHDRMGESGTSSLSPHLRFGEISPREVWHAAQANESSGGVEAFLRQLVWREFAICQMIQFPHIVDTPLDRGFEALPTRMDEDAFEAWRKGHTGYPVVDAGMRELLATGWMHNRARMLTASFLIKHLGIPWQIGAQWFWDKLVDADLANNSMNWQWVAGSGIDASPFYRIFNPTRQGARFDPDGLYVRQWVPELAKLGDRLIHEPWNSTGTHGSYPEPIVNHETARRAALEAYAQVRIRKANLAS